MHLSDSSMAQAATFLALSYLSGLAAARGALRESGKLIVNLDIKDICEMLRLKDTGDEHNIILIERIDDMLMRLER